MATYQTDLSAIFGALSDPTRFAVVDRLARGPASVSELARPFDMAGPTFLKHLKVLEQAGTDPILQAWPRAYSAVGA